MKLIKPFRAVRPTKELASQVASPPYDVVNRAEAREITALLRGSINASQTVISGNILARAIGVSGRTGVRGIFYCLLDALATI